MTPSGRPAPPAFAGTPAADPSDRLRAVLPADVADRVLAVIADARAHALPAAALEHRALQLASKGAAPADVERAVRDEETEMSEAKDAIQRGRGSDATDDEVEAGAAAMSKGVDGAQVSAIAKDAPSGRSLTVPMFVIASLIDRGLSAREALTKVEERLTARASDAELAKLPEQASAGQARRPSTTGRDLAATKRAGVGGGRPAGVPANAGGAGRPGGVTHPGRP